MNNHVITEPALDWLEDPEVFAVNRLEAHSDHKIYGRYEDMESKPEGSFRQSLNGTWKFSYAENPEERKADFFRTDSSLEGFDSIQVPGHIQLQGYDRCQYVNTKYPWIGHEALYPPQIPKKHNPVGCYVKLFDLDETLEGKEVYISFQGVETAFYVWLNGNFVGYSEDSFTPAEFRLTDYVKKTDNRLAVEVYKHSSASWIEDQDFWRFSGIFREVYLYAVPAVHVQDLFIHADYDHAEKSGLLSLEIQLTKSPTYPAEETVLRLRLFDADGVCVWEERKDNPESYVKTAVRLETVHPWSAEDPYLYQLIAELQNTDGTVIEIAAAKTGFRTFRIENGIMKLNGRRILFKGVDRHEFSDRLGRAIGKAEMLADIRMMKQNNINAVRTSHYPNQSLWYALCDEYGIYLIDETNLESHGAWNRIASGGEVWNVPGSKPEWKACVIDRANSMLARDKNHPSVLLWSCGNESYAGDNIRAMSDYFHEKDPSRPVHYEGVFHCRAYDALSDVESRMYAKPQEIREYLQNDPKKPYISCEYMHAMGNSLGGIHKYTELEDEFEAYQGGFIWDFIDQALIRTDETGREVYAYGGDFDDRPADYGFCTDGIVYPNRKASPKMQEVKAVYSNLRMRIADGMIRIENRNLFISTAGYLFRITLEQEGRVIKTAVIEPVIVPGECAVLPIPFEKPEQAGEYVYQIAALLKADTKWAARGYEVAFAQEAFTVEATGAKSDGFQKSPVHYPKPLVIDDISCFAVIGSDFQIQFDRNQGGLSSVCYDGVEYLAAIPRVSFWRATTDNDSGASFQRKSAQWLLAGKMAAEDKSGQWIKEEKDRILVHFAYTAPTIPEIRYEITYTVNYAGEIYVRVTYPGVKGMPDMPVMALDVKMKRIYSRVQYYGMGPEENYGDRNRGAKLGVYQTTAQENVSLYLNPQECGNRTGVRYTKISDGKGHGLTFSKYAEPFEMSVLPYSAYELDTATHLEELPQPCYTWVRLAAAQMGVGGDDSWGAPVHEEYRLSGEEPRSLEFVISRLETD